MHNSIRTIDRCLETMNQWLLSKAHKRYKNRRGEDVCDQFHVVSNDEMLELLKQLSSIAEELVELESFFGEEPDSEGGE